MSPIVRITGLLCIVGLSRLMTNGGMLQSAEVIRDPEVFAVYAAVLPIVFQSGVPSRISIQQETTAPAIDCLLRHPVGAWQSAGVHYREQNRTVYVLPPDANLGVPYLLVTRTDLRESMRRVGYDPLTSPQTNAPGSKGFRLLPGRRLIAFSAVGFSPDGTLAVVVVQEDCLPYWPEMSPGQRCHGGNQLLLRKFLDKWTFAAAGCGWAT